MRAQAAGVNAGVKNGAIRKRSGNKCTVDELLVEYLALQYLLHVYNTMKGGVVTINTRKFMLYITERYGISVCLRSLRRRFVYVMVGLGYVPSVKFIPRGDRTDKYYYFRLTKEEVGEVLRRKGLL